MKIGFLPLKSQNIFNELKCYPNGAMLIMVKFAGVRFMRFDSFGMLMRIMFLVLANPEAKFQGHSVAHHVLVP